MKNLEQDKLMQIGKTIQKIVKYQTLLDLSDEQIAELYREMEGTEDKAILLASALESAYKCVKLLNK